MLTYNYMLKEFEILQNVRKGNISPLDLLKTKRGDAYDFAVIFTALLRANGIAALPDSGILVESDLRTRPHWWSEFYVPGFGWIPVDIALAAGLDYHPWQKDIVPHQFYFGNLDGQHIPLPLKRILLKIVCPAGSAQQLNHQLIKLLSSIYSYYCRI